MICKNCGWKIYDKAAVCPHCGAPTENAVKKKKEKKNKRVINGYAIAGLSLGAVGILFCMEMIFFIFPLLGIIFSAIALYKSKKLGGKKLAILGLVISIIGMVVWLFVWITVLVTMITTG